MIRPRRILSSVATCLTSTVLLSAAASAASASTAKTEIVLKVWSQEAPTSALGVAYAEANKIFEKEHPGVKIAFQVKSFEQMMQSGSMFLSTGSAPDLLEYNKGTASTGLLVKQGLLTNLDSAAKQFGWGKLMSLSLQTTERYASNGLMGSGDWYGVSPTAEFQLVYYNQAEFKKYRIPIPTTFTGLESAMSEFVKHGVTPLAISGAEYPTEHLWYELALRKANRQFVDQFQEFKGKVNWEGPQFRYASNELLDWIKAGYISKNSVGLSANQMAQEFTTGQSPIMISGDWWYGAFESGIKKFAWTTTLFPGNTLTNGSGGNVWIVPKGSSNKSLDYQYINLLLQPQIQRILSNAGGIPINLGNSKITNPKSLALINDYKVVNRDNGFAYYADWPVPGFYNEMVSNLQDLMAGKASVSQFLSTVGGYYVHQATLQGYGSY